MEKSYYIYIIRCDDNSLYTGITTDLSRRFSQHQTKTGAKYTRTHQVVKIEAFWQVSGRSEATKLECKIKKLTKMQKENLIKFPDKFNLL